MPRTIEQNQELRDESRTRIMHAALTLFARQGFERTTVRMIAEEAGISQGLMYNYFSSKHDLLRAIFEQSMRDVTESFAIAEAEPDPQQRIQRLVTAAFVIVRRHREFWQLSYGVRMQPEVLAGLGDALPAWTSSITHTLEGYFQDAGAAHPRIEAAILFALIDGVAQHYVLDPEHYPLDEVAKAILVRYQ